MTKTPKTPTDIITDIARTTAVAAGHMVEGAGRTAQTIPGMGGPGRVAEAMGRTMSKTALDICGRDTPRLKACNGDPERP